MKHSKDTIELVKIMLRHSSIRQVALCLNLTKGQVSRIKASHIDLVSRAGERKRPIITERTVPTVPFVPGLSKVTRYYQLEGVL